MPGLAAGTRLLVRYVGAEEDLWHERIVLGRTRGASNLILTPDGDVYEENYSEENPDVAGVRVLRGRELPQDLEEADVYRFDREVTARQSWASP